MQRWRIQRHSTTLKTASTRRKPSPLLQKPTNKLTGKLQEVPPGIFGGYPTNLAPSYWTQLFRRTRKPMGIKLNTGKSPNFTISRTISWIAILQSSKWTNMLGRTWNMTVTITIRNTINTMRTWTVSIRPAQIQIHERSERWGKRTHFLKQIDTYYVDISVIINIRGKP